MHIRPLCTALLTAALLGGAGMVWSWPADGETTAAAAGDDVPADKLKPHWEVGDQWVVETTSQVQQSGTDGKQKPKSKPIQWQFTVQKPEPNDPKGCYRVEVKCLTPGRQPAAVLWADQKSLALKRVETQLPVQGQWRKVVESYQSAGDQPSPVLGPLTALPLDMPVFQSGTKSLQKFTYEAIAGPEGTKAVGDLGFAFEVDQHVAPAGAEQVKGLLHEDFAKELTARPAVEVKLVTSERTVRQLWQPGEPWPSYSSNGRTEARLVKVVRAKK
jgi:hypothetical protein